jgi:hypothetical protein
MAKSQSPRVIITRIYLREIAEKLQPIAPATIHRDLVHLRQQAQENPRRYIHEVVSEEHQKCMVEMKRNLKHVLEIGEAATDPKIKLEARRIANNCYRYIMDLCTNAGIVSDALKFVTQKQEQINTLKKLDERIQGQQQQQVAEEEETTTRVVF